MSDTTRCPYCGGTEMDSGYGLAAGPMGSYTYCSTEGCGELIAFAPDLSGLDDDHVAALKEEQAEWDKKMERISRMSQDARRYRFWRDHPTGEFITVIQKTGEATLRFGLKEGSSTFPFSTPERVDVALDSAIAREEDA